MEKEMKNWKAVSAFLMGSAMALGAAFLASKVCGMRGPVRTRQGKYEGPEARPCSVPEGADICFPEQKLDGPETRPCSVPEGADICYPG